MQFFREKRKQVVILVLCAALLTAGAGLAKRFLWHLEGGDSPVVDCEVAPAGMDVETHQLLLGGHGDLKRVADARPACGSRGYLPWNFL